MASHSTVQYIEPNSMQFDWAVKDDFERAPRLEDYCIAMNIEVELSSRMKNAKDSSKEVLILQYTRDADGKRDKISFMGGTKIGGYNYEGLDRKSKLDPSGTRNDIYNALTTYYADMYVGDLVDYGTTEMIGIKSVNIEYQKSCVPIVTIQFTDVRGLSLFQPTELSRDNTYNGIKGIDGTNVAQSFFQCFYKMPIPKFTIYIKGFYGKPVAYEVMCDKFDTNFDSDNGNFDCTARFIGYSYSFMTDVSLDALLVAPYSDYIGKKYWQDNVNNGTFYVWDKTKTTKMPMPTLYEVKTDIERLVRESNEQMEETTLTEEETKHEEEIETLKKLRGLYSTWYAELFEVVQQKYGKRYCHIFRENGEDGDYYRIIVLTNSETIEKKNLSSDYEQYSEDFKDTNKELYAAVEEYNKSGFKYKTFDNVSLDFSKYTRQNIFNKCYVNRNTRNVEFGGFHRDCKLPRKEVVSCMFPSGSTQYVLYAIYGDGVDQYTDGFVIEVDYSDIKKRINALQRDANRDVDERTKEKAIKEHNRIMIGKMNWYPTIENFTRIMLAHLETLMAMMYEVSKAAKGRTAKSLGVTTGPDGTCSDTNPNDEEIPPFPRVTEETIGDDFITKREDTWVGDLTNGDGFVETEIVNGLFNAVEYIQQLVKQDKQVMEALSSPSDEPKVLIKQPLTPFDFFLTKNPYGSDSDIVNNPNAFAAKVAFRMFAVMCLNPLKTQYGSKWSYGDTNFIKMLAKIEADNFYENVKLTNRRLLEMLSGSNNVGQLTPEAILSLVTANSPINGDIIPWGDRKLFSGDLWLNGYKTKTLTSIYPIEEPSFNALERTFNYFNSSSNKIDAENKSNIVSYIDASSNFMTLFRSSDKTAFNNLFIVDDHNKIKSAIESSTSLDNNDYKPIYELLSSDSLYNGEKFAKFIKKDGRTSFRRKIDHTNKKATSFYTQFTNDALSYKKGEESVNYDIDDAAIASYCTEIDNGNIQSCTLTEAFGYRKVKNPSTNAISYEIDYDNSLFMNGEIDSIHGWLDGVMNYKECQMAFFVMSLDCIDHQATFDTLSSSNKAFNYLPKLAVLQIGAILTTIVNGSSINLMSMLTLNSISSKLMVSRSSNIDKLLPYLNYLNPTVKVAYMKYFISWARNNYSRVMTLNNKQKSVKGNEVNKEYAAFYSTVGEKVRRLFNENSELVKNLTNDLMSIVIIVKGSIYHKIGASEQKITKEQAKVYLDAFIERLKEKYKVGYQEDENGNITRITETPKKTSKDMKKELYRYLKLLYDKWIPTTDEADWKYETFFNYEDHNNNKGHLFHFIDSFYNKIGDKLIINPLSLAEKIGAAFDNNNGEVSIMMLGFMADIYAKNKCMLMCLQNFMNLSMQSNMEVMFKPIPFSEMGAANKHPDFVVVYPYEPSKNLNVDNAEYNNDAFMLNDEHETPIAIRSRSEGDDGKYYRIPAFGVTYGKQYQSYFKKISVNTQSPIATQQAILAKHAILMASRDSNSKTTVGQDIYDVYTTQSYSCKVEMMGCAWVQPLMYFVLLNVPMFRGSYLIMKVSHKLSQGKMTTEFTGVRMANVSNKLVEEIFTDETDLFGGGQMYEEAQREREGSLDNNCPYKVFPLDGDSTSTIDISGNEKDVGLSLMRKLIGLGYNEYAAAGVVGNMYEESYDYKKTKQRFKYNMTVSDKGVSGGLCMWRNENLIALTQKNPKRYGVNAERINPTDANIKSYSDKLTSVGLDYQLEFLKKTMSSEAGWSPYKLEKYNKEATSARGAAENFRAKYERGGANAKSMKNRADFAEAIYKLYKSSGKETKANTSDKKLNDKDVRDMFFEALQKSCESTSAVKCGIEKTNIESSATKKKIVLIKQSDGKATYLATIFDIILNGYYDYVQSLWWSYSNDLREEPIGIYVEPSLKVTPNKRIVVACKGGQLAQYSVSFDENTNKGLMTALSKKYISMDSKYWTKEVPQLGNNKELLEKFKADDCTSNGGGSTSISNGGGTNANPSEVTNNPLSKDSVIKSKDKTKFKDWKVYYAVQHLISHAKSKSIKLCATYVENAIAAGGIPRPACGKENGSAATNLRYLGILERHGFVQIYSGNIPPHGSPSQPIQAGDVSIIGAQGGSKPFHACMYTGKQWISDFRQNNMNVYGSTQPYAIYRYQNNPITTA